MTTVLALAAYAALAGAVAPYALARARWAHQAPKAAVVVWQGLMAAFVVTTASAVYQLALVEQHMHSGLVGLFSLCGLSRAATGSPAPTPADALPLLPPLVVVLVPTGLLLYCLRQTGRAQRRSLDMLALVGRPAPEYGATVVDHAAAAVYCLPGRSRRIVVTQGALDALTDAQLRAVLAHERAHIEGRHHLLHATTRAFQRAFPGLPLARLAREQTALPPPSPRRCCRCCCRAARRWAERGRRTAAARARPVDVAGPVHRHPRPAGPSQASAKVFSGEKPTTEVEPCPEITNGRRQREPHGPARRLPSNGAPGRPGRDGRTAARIVKRLQP
ncbi:M56 family metallopeptidase [Streptomyces sp. B8F3]|uniref:M56 family metallopeptidase n=1 Tax=Streptomyces sp. B8F3 TaxID=3153573 RepID=UPI00325F40CC